MPVLRLLVIGASTVERCGVRAHGAVLDAALRECGVSVERMWWERPRGAGTASARRSLARWGEQLQAALDRDPPDAVLWHYNAWAYDHRGVPLLAPQVVGALSRSSVPLVTLLHEFAYPLRRRGWRGLAWAASQRAVLPAIARRSAGLVATTEDRTAWLATRQWLPRRPLLLAPVFATLPVRAGPRPAAARPLRAGVLSFAREEFLVEPVVEAVAELARDGRPVTLTLIGAPGPGNPHAQRWERAARRAGCTEELSFTGVLDEAGLAGAVIGLDVAIHPDAGGPTSRKTTLAATLESGIPIIAFDGPSTWSLYRRSGAIQLVAPTGPAVAAALARLATDPELRAEQGARGASLYRSAMSPAVVAARLSTFVESLLRRGAPSTVPRGGRDVEISVVHHDDLGLIRACLATLPAACSGIDWHVTVIDNGAGGPELATLVAALPRATLIRNRSPQGFGANHNRVIGGVVSGRTARHVLVLNDDTELDGGSVSSLVRHADLHPRLGAVAPAVRDRSGLPQVVVTRHPTVWGEFTQALNGRRPPPKRKGWLNGCCLLLRTEALALTGGFDEDYYLFYEDADLGLRLSLAGWEFGVCELAAVVHAGHATVMSGGRGRAAEEHMARSRHLYFEKHRGRRTASAMTALQRVALSARLAKAGAGVLIGRGPRERALAGRLRRQLGYDPRQPPRPLR